MAAPKRSAGSVSFADDSVKSMVAFDAPTDTLNGRCARATSKNVQVTSAGVTGEMFCYFAGVDDYAP